MRRITIIGAGSVVFCKTLMMDIMATKGLEETEFVLMDLDITRLEYTRKFMNKIISKYNLSTKVSITTDRREALKEANFVICTIQVGGMKAFEVDYKIPLKYGVDQCIGDTVGPGGIFRALRTIPVMIDIANDMKELCPDALLLNYTNPMSAVCWALAEEGINVVGLCHGVQTTMDLISSYVDIPKDDIDYICAGINHMGWFLKLEHKGRDIYPLLKANFEKPDYYINEKVRGEVMRHFGYFMTESTGHLSEYLPYFRKNERGLNLYCDMPDFGGESGAYYRHGIKVAERYLETDIFKEEEVMLPERSIEYCSYIIEALELDKTFKFNGNIRNNGMIQNLPHDCCTEVTIYADGSGLHPTYIGSLPSQLASLNQTNINVHRLCVEAAKSSDPEKIVYAMALDPLTSAKLTLKEIRDMAYEMLEASRAWLPQYKGKQLELKETIIIPEDVVPREAPVDPALAIAERLTKLVE